VIGIALRFAYTLGLHVRNEDPSASPTKKEMLVRVWWSLYNLERLLGTITGRPSAISDTCCSVSLPLPVQESQLSDNPVDMERLRKLHSSTPTPISPIFPTSSYGIGSTGISQAPHEISTRPDANSGSYFRAMAQLSIINQNIHTKLYSSGISMRSVGDVQEDMKVLFRSLDEWVAALPMELNFQNRATPGEGAFLRERTLLGLSLCSSKLLLTRPCLGSRVQSADTGATDRFVLGMAKRCVDSAKSVVNFLPDRPDTVTFYELGPWWCIIHHMMQAMSVFLLALAQTTPSSSDINSLSPFVEKLIRWLWAMQDPLGERAYRIALAAWQLVAAKFSIDVADPVGPYISPDYTADTSQEIWYEPENSMNMYPQQVAQFGAVPSDTDSAFGMSMNPTLTSEFPSSIYPPYSGP
jgi:hypothetical protein